MRDACHKSSPYIRNKLMSVLSDQKRPPEHPLKRHCVRTCGPTSKHTHLGVVDDALQGDGVDATGAEHRQRVFAGEHNARVGGCLADLVGKQMQSGRVVCTRRTSHHMLPAMFGYRCFQLRDAQQETCNKILCRMNCSQTEARGPLSRFRTIVGLPAGVTCRSRPSGPQHASGGCCESHISTHVSVMDMP